MGEFGLVVEGTAMVEQMEEDVFGNGRELGGRRWAMEVCGDGRELGGRR